MSKALAWMFCATASLSPTKPKRKKRRAKPSSQKSSTNCQCRELQIMNTLTDKTTEQVQAKSTRITTNTLHVRLDDGREVSVPFAEVPWLKWLAKATPKQRANWSIE